MVDDKRPDPDALLAQIVLLAPLRLARALRGREVRGRSDPGSPQYRRR